MVKSPLCVLLFRFIAVLFLFSLSRIVFYAFNFDSFPQANFITFCSGMRFDISIILYINSLYFILMLLPFRFITQKWFKKTGDIYFVTVNSFAILLNLIDTCYYPFSLRRMTFDIFRFVGETNNFSELLPIFLKEYFYMFFIWAAFILLFIFTVILTNKIDYQYFAKRSCHLAKAIGIRLIFAFLILTGMRGGWQYRPINISAAGGMGGIENAALVLNSPFSLLTTIQSEQLERKFYFKNEIICDEYFTPEHKTFENQYIKTPPTQNIVLIILEGISSEYSAFLSHNGNISGYTPFLDSIAQKSIVFRGYANGQQSIETLPSILGGIPSLMNRPFTQSQYANAQVQYAVPLMNKKGYCTAFFHGGKNGTMGFDSYCSLLGISHYYGCNEYPQLERDFDGTWGIPDYPYLQYVSSTLNTFSQPFFATIYTLSSHHPFTVPEPFNKTLPKGDFDMQHAVAYTDRALQDFFKQAQKSDWYEHTLFVITADHTNFAEVKNIDYQAKRYSIPMIFFHPQADTAFVSDRIMQQIDIMPSIFAYCHWNEPFFSFGNNVFDTKLSTFAINYNTSIYHFFVDNYMIEFNGKDITSIWDLTESAPRHPLPLSADSRFLEYEKKLKSVIQQFNNRFLDNHLRNQ